MMDRVTLDVWDDGSPIWFNIRDNRSHIQFGIEDAEELHFKLGQAIKGVRRNEEIDEFDRRIREQEDLQDRRETNNDIT